MPEHGPPADWSAGEQRMWHAYREGVWCEDAAEVRGEAVRTLLLSAPPPLPGRLARLRMRATHIRGACDLDELSVASTVRLQQCRFDEAPSLGGARVEALELTECELPGLSLLGASIAQECEIVACTVTDTLDMRSLGVGSWLSLKDTRVRAPAGHAAIDAQSLAVDEDFWAIGLDCAGPMYLNNARIQDVLVLRRARVGSPGHGGMQAPELTVGGGLYLDDHFSSSGMVNLYRASIGGSLSMSHATLTGPNGGPGEYALHLGCAEIGGEIYAGKGGLVVRGPVDLRDTTVRGSVVLTGARVEHPDGTALRAARLHVGGDLDCRDGFGVLGTVDLSDARIGGSVLLEGAELTAPPDAPALRANGIEAQSVINLCDGFTAHGTVHLNSATARSHLCLSGALLDAPEGEVSLACRGASTAMLSLRPREAPAGTVDLSHARIGLLQDEPATWPRALSLDGTAYESVRPLLPAARRLPWLGRGPYGFVPQPYEQLAAAYRRQGRDADARTVLVAQHRGMRRGLVTPARLWSLLQDAAVGYGYRPLRAVWLLACILTAGALLFDRWPPRAVGEGRPPDFQPVIYTLDLLLPLVDLGQERAYASSGAMQWTAVALVALGWLLASTVAAGTGRVLRRN